MTVSIVLAFRLCCYTDNIAECITCPALLSWAGDTLRTNSCLSSHVLSEVLEGFLLQSAAIGLWQQHLQLLVNMLRLHMLPVQQSTSFSTSD